MSAIGNPVVPYSTAAHTSTNLTFRSVDVPASLVVDIASDFAGTGTIPIYYVGADDTRLTAVLDADGLAFELSSTNKHLSISSPCVLRIVKAETADGAMGVNLHKDQL